MFLDLNLPVIFDPEVDFPPNSHPKILRVVTNVGKVVRNLQEKAGIVAHESKTTRNCIKGRLRKIREGQQLSGYCILAVRTFAQGMNDEAGYFQRKQPPVDE